MRARVLSALAAAALALSAVVAAAAPVAAADPLARALAAMGQGRGLRFRAVHQGTSFASEQARSPADAVAEAPRTYRWSYDGPSGRIVREAEQLFPGGIKFWTRTSLAPGGGWQVDLLKWRQGVDLDAASAAEATALTAQYERYFPHLLLRQAERARSTLTAAPGGFRYRDAAGKLIEVALDPASALPSSASELVDGKPQATLAYSGYSARGGVKLPARIRFTAGGQLREDLRLTGARFVPPPPRLFALPPGYVPPPPAAKPSAREIAPGLVFFDGMPPFNYHSMAVEQERGIVLLEAPSSPAYAEEQRRLLAALWPGKAVTHVLVTHHHGDHTAGLSKWAEWGAEIVVAKGAAVALARQFAARGTKPAARIVELDGRRSFGSGRGRVDAYALATGHAEAQLIVHVPAAKLLFQGDLFYLPERGPVPPAFPVVEELRAAIARFGLDVETIVGVHGRAGSMAELEASLALRKNGSGRRR